MIHSPQQRNKLEWPELQAMREALDLARQEHAKGNKLFDASFIKTLEEALQIGEDYFHAED